ncbi:NADH-cytochrome b5 reductase-like [Saccoglossus kowalevskii]|uniref:NADH-cytochrome b5 reductase n=1 Tax=Saccoglossus kowalevskii TaxID=10224 RepID=A0ABM0GJJ1_SACKO|nr:PREDICTED: NADH-cytochrome b5 reductase-like [Saccoglossus kowalevskii]
MMGDSSHDLKWLPEKPSEPLPSDCCGTGCVPCVFDLYEEDLKLWEEKTKQGPVQAVQCDTQDDVEPAISPAQYTSFVIDSITNVSSDSKIYRFKIPGNKSFGLNIGQHLILRGEVNGEVITRQYTPISTLDLIGYFDVLIKIYQNGKMSSYIKTWNIGDKIEWRGPFGTFSYKPNKFQRIIMFAAGTGLAPMLQIIQSIVCNKDEDTFVRLIFCCRTYEDILLKSTLNEFAAYWNFTVCYVLSQEPNTSIHRYGEEVHYGRLDEDLVVKETTPVRSNTMILICGTKSFDKDIIKYITKTGYTKDCYFKF